MASTINITLPESLVAYVEARTEAGVFDSRDQYVRELIEHDRNEQRRKLEQRLLDSLHDEKNAIEIPDDVLDHGDIVSFLEEYAEQHE